VDASSWLVKPGSRKACADFDADTFCTLDDSAFPSLVNVEARLDNPLLWLGPLKRSGELVGVPLPDEPSNDCGSELPRLLGGGSLALWLTGELPGGGGALVGWPKRSINSSVATTSRGLMLSQPPGGSNNTVDPPEGPDELTIKGA
jgi:hypothetical protein